MRTDRDPDLRVDHDPDLWLDHDPDLRLAHDPDLRLDHDPDLRLDHDPDLRLDQDPDLRLDHDPDIRLDYDPDLRVVWGSRQARPPGDISRGHGSSHRRIGLPTKSTETIHYYTVSRNHHFQITCGLIAGSNCDVAL